MKTKSAVLGIGGAVRLLRTIRSISQSDLAALARLTPAFISRIESGERVSSFENLRNIAEVLGTKVSHLVVLSDCPEDVLIKQLCKVSWRKING